MLSNSILWYAGTQFTSPLYGGTRTQGQPYAVVCQNGGYVTSVTLGGSSVDGVLTSIQIYCSNSPNAAYSFSVADRASTTFRSVTSGSGFNFASVYTSNSGQGANPIVSLTVGGVNGQEVVGGVPISTTTVSGTPTQEEQIILPQSARIFGFDGTADSNYINGLQIYSVCPSQ